MITARLTPRTFLIGSDIYEIDQEIELTDPEQAVLGQIAELTTRINDSRVQVFQLCWSTTRDVDPELADAYYEFEDMRFEHSTKSTGLLRTICRRLGGILPLSLDVQRDTPRVLVRQTHQDEAVTIDRKQAAASSLYNRAIGDIEAMLPAFLGTEDRATLLNNVRCTPESWYDFGCPYVITQTGAIGIDPNYADGLQQFIWQHHENVQLDRAVTLGIGRLLGQPNRIAALQNGTHPFPMIAVVVGAHETVLMNLTETNETDDPFRLMLLDREMARVGGKLLAIAQFGPLEQTGSAVDMQDGPNRPHGITVSLAIHTDDAIIQGGKSWTLQQPNQQTAPSLMTYGVFEDTPGLPGADPEKVLPRLFSLSFNDPGAPTPAAAAEDEPVTEPAEATESAD
jgi:hypothetical protein